MYESSFRCVLFVGEGVGLSLASCVFSAREGADVIVVRGENYVERRKTFARLRFMNTFFLGHVRVVFRGEA